MPKGLATWTPKSAARMREPRVEPNLPLASAVPSVYYMQRVGRRASGGAAGWAPGGGRRWRAPEECEEMRGALTVKNRCPRRPTMGPRRGRTNPTTDTSAPLGGCAPDTVDPTEQLYPATFASPSLSLSLSFSVHRRRVPSVEQARMTGSL